MMCQLFRLQLHFTYPESTEELVERHGLAAVAIEVLDEHADLLVVQVDVECLKPITQFICIELPVTVVIEDAEYSSDTSQSH